MPEAHDGKQGPLSGEYFLIRDWNVEIKIQNYLGEKWTEPKVLLQGSITICFELEESKAISEKYAVYFLSLHHDESRQIEQNPQTNRLSTLPAPFTRAKHNGLNDGKDIMLWIVAYRLPVNKKTIIAPWVTRMTEWGKEREKTPEEVCQLGNFSSLFRY